MLTILFFFIIPIVSGVAFLIYWHREFGVDFYGILISLLLMFAVFMFAGIFTTIISSLQLQEPVLEEAVPLYAIEDGSSISGSFFLGSGGFSSDRRYYYVADYKDGKKICSIKESKSYIVESNEAPTIDVYTSQFVNEWLRENLVNLSEEKEYKITIPKNSIKYDFNIDLK